MRAAAAAVAILWSSGAAPETTQELFRYHAGEQSHWVSPENRHALRNGGGAENKGAKGHAWDNILAGATYTLAEVHGAGTVDRIWLTIDDRSAETLRALKLEIYWDGAAAPAVSVPLGDFFLHGTGEMVAMETALLASPEGRSFVSYVPMPFRNGARVTITNEGPKTVNIFYDVDYRTVASQPADALYFHAWWHRERATKLGRDFRILPSVSGRGRFLGASVAVLTNPAYGQSWWGEGEVKIRLEGEAQPSMVGTGTEDYVGSAWGQGVYVNRFQGSPVASWDGGGRWSFYRFHIPDPIWFERGIEVSIQQIGGAPRQDVLRLLKERAPLIPVSVDTGTRAGGFHSLLATGKQLSDPDLPDAWTNFYRSDDVAAVAYFYLDRPGGVLPPIAPVGERTAGLRRPSDDYSGAAPIGARR